MEHEVSVLWDLAWDWTRDIDLSIHFLTVHFIQGQHFRSDGAGFGSFTKGMGLNLYTTTDILNNFNSITCLCFFLFFKLCAINVEKQPTRPV